MVYSWEKTNRWDRRRDRARIHEEKWSEFSLERVQDWLSGKLIAYPLKGRIKIKAAGLINCPTMDRRHKHSTCEIK